MQNINKIKKVKCPVLVIHVSVSSEVLSFPSRFFCLLMLVCNKWLKKTTMWMPLFIGQIVFAWFLDWKKVSLSCFLNWLIWFFFLFNWHMRTFFSTDGIILTVWSTFFLGITAILGSKPEELFNLSDQVFYRYGFLCLCLSDNHEVWCAWLSWICTIIVYPRCHKFICNIIEN